MSGVQGGVQGGGGGGGGTVDSVIAGAGIEVDSSNPASPVVSVDPTVVAPADSGFILDAADAALPNSRVLTDSLGILWDLTTPGQVSANLTQSAITQAQILARGLGA